MVVQTGETMLDSSRRPRHGTDMHTPPSTPRGSSTAVDMLLSRKNLASVLARRIAFKEMVTADRQYEELRKKYRPINSGSNSNGVQANRVSYAASSSKTVDNHSVDDNDTPNGDATTLSPSSAASTTELYPRSALTFRWQKVSKIGCGLDNAGNTCFMNSVLQCLLYTPALANYLLARTHTSTCRVQAGFCALCEMQSLAVQCCSPMSNGANNGRSVMPRGFIRNLKAIAKSLSAGRQEDAHEFLRHLIDAMQRSCLTGLPRDLPPRTKETTLIHHLFGGHLRSTVQCRVCGHESHCEDAFMDLALDVKGCASVEQALRLFTKDDVLSGSNRYKCERCKKPVDAVKHMRILDAPPILTVQFKRFHYGFYGGGKINKHVQFGDTLDLAPYMAKTTSKMNKAMQNSGLRYKLYAVLVHTGSSNCGHYYSFVKSAADTWYSMDDSSVSQVKLSTVLQQNAYVLFYTLLDNVVAPAPTIKTQTVLAQNRTQVQNGAPVETGRVSGISAKSQKHGETTPPPSPTPPISKVTPTSMFEKLFAKPDKAKKTEKVGKSTVVAYPSPASASKDAPGTSSKFVSAFRALLGKKEDTAVETKTPAPTSVNVTAVITPEAKNPPAIVAKPIPARAAPIIVSWDDDMESKRGKLEEVIAQERQNKEQKKTDIDTVLFSRPAAKWDESAPTITTVTPTTTTTKKFKRPTLLDAEYDCGKVKKRRTSNWQVFDHQRSEGNPFTKFQQHVRDAKQRVKSKSFFKAARRKVE